MLLTTKLHCTALYPSASPSPAMSPHPLTATAEHRLPTAQRQPDASPRRQTTRHCATYSGTLLQLMHHSTAITSSAVLPNASE